MLSGNFDKFSCITKWRHGGFRGPLTIAQKKVKEKCRLKKKNKKIKKK